MPRRRDDTDESPIRVLLDRLGDRGPNGPSLHEQLLLLAQARTESSDVSLVLDRWLVNEIDGLRGGLAEAQKRQDELRQLHARLTSPPWCAAVFLRPVNGAGDSPAHSPANRALVSCLGSPRVVSLADGLQMADLASGQDVLLTHDLNVLLQGLTPGVPRASEVAEFHYTLGDGRLVLKARDSEVIVSAAATLLLADLRTGDRVRWDPALAMAFEQLPRPSASSLFLADTPADRFADIGGLDRQIARLQRSIRLHMRHQALVERYQLRRASSVLLVGPPGTGKTMVARALANWLGEEAPGGRATFMHIKPGALHSMWFSQSEANYRDAFRVAREAGARQPGVPVVLFFDEVDAIGLTRGDQGLARVDDRVLTSFMAELDGLEARGNVLVVAATNRRDALDPALLRPGRLGDLVLEIPRPSMDAARAILERHLSPTVPYAESDGGVPARRDVIDAAVSRLYAPNADGEVATITFRDGTRRAIGARELVSGAMLANVARVATETACVRELETGEAGIRRTDVLTAVVDELERAVSTLTPSNCHAHIAGLPQDLAVARVEPIVRATRRLHQMVECRMNVPKVIGADVELSNFILGWSDLAGTGHVAARRLLGAVEGISSGVTATAQSLDWGRKYLPSNGGCTYIDSDHLEVALCETLSAFDHVAHWRAMLRLVQAAQLRVNEGLPPGCRLHVLANNSDGQGNSYGSHVNVLLTREAWDNIFCRRPHYLAYLAAFQISSIVITGQGKVGAERDRPAVDFQLSQRADFIQTLVSLDTMVFRGVVNSRDEPLCGQPRHRVDPPLARLHVIFFDSTLCQVSTLLRVGMLQMVVAMLEAGRVDTRLALEDPLAALEAFSRDPSLTASAPLVSGAARTAVELQWQFLADARRFHATGGFDGIVPHADHLLHLWEDTLAQLDARNWAVLGRRLDWVVKRELLQGVINRRPDLTWQSPAVRHLDQLYASLDPADGLFWALEREGRVDQVVDDAAVSQAEREPPGDTRAWTRAHLLRLAGRNHVEQVDWDRMTISVPAGRPSYTRSRVVHLPVPFGDTQADNGRCFLQDAPVSAVLEELGAVDEPYRSQPASYAPEYWTIHSGEPR